MPRNDDYPLPSHAASIWHAGDALMVGLPATTPGGRGHTLRIPLDRATLARTDTGAVRADQSGWAVLLQLLQARAHAPPERMRVGHAAAPVQYDVDALMRARQPTRYDAHGVERREVDAAKLGL